MKVSRFTDAQKLEMFDDLVEQIDRMTADYDEGCDDAFQIAQTMRRAIDAIEGGLKMLRPHASVMLVEDKKPKRRR